MRGIKLATVGLWSSGNTFSGVVNHASPSDSLTNKSGFSRYLEKARWWRRNIGLGLFFMVRARPLSSSEGKSWLYNDILDDSVLPTQWHRFGLGLFLFQHDNPPVHKAWSIQERFVEIGVEELDWPAQSPDLNSIKQLWDELDRRLQARPNCPTSVPTSQMLVAEWKQVPTTLFQHVMESIPKRVEAVIAAKGGPTPY